MDKLKKFTIPTAVILLFFIIFYRWLGNGILSGGDWPYLFPKAIQEVSPFSSWDLLFNNGMGQSAFPKIWFDAYALTIVKIAQFLPWGLFERLIWFFPYVLISFFSSYFLAKKMGLSSNFSSLAGVIYSINTYSLLLVSGGQAGVFMAYAFLPFVFYTLFNLLEKFTLRSSILFSLFLSFLILLDLRVGYIFLVAFFVLSVIHIIFYRKDFIKKILYIFAVPGFLTFALHIFWIGPILIMGRNPASQLTDIYTSSLSLDFFSFAKMENGLSLLHPNWPENIFGKVAFLRPEFLILPLLAFSSLFFIANKKTKNQVTFASFIFIALIGIFFAKGTNDPFGELYRIAFNYIPGFVMFRDPTKWYMLISISFSILIPYAIYNFLNLKILKNLKKAEMLVCIIFLFFYSFLIKEAIFGDLKGTLHPRPIPVGFQKLAQKIANDEEYYRTLWVPVYPTLAYVSNTHPAVPAVEFFKAVSNENLLMDLNKSQNIQKLRNSSVKYVIIPEDIYGRIFVTDRKYDEKVYQNTLEGLRENPNLHEVGRYGKTVVFEIENPKDHFWSTDRNVKINTEYKSPTHFSVNLSNAKKGDKIIFAETYDKFWEANNDKFTVTSENFNELNSFILPQSGDFKIEVRYKPQEWLKTGLFISLGTLTILVWALFYMKKKRT